MERGREGRPKEHRRVSKARRGKGVQGEWQEMQHERLTGVALAFGAVKTLFVLPCAFGAGSTDPVFRLLIAICSRRKDLSVTAYACSEAGWPSCDPRWRCAAFDVRCLDFRLDGWLVMEVIAAGRTSSGFGQEFIGRFHTGKSSGRSLTSPGQELPFSAPSRRVPQKLNTP